MIRLTEGVLDFVFIRGITKDTYEDVFNTTACDLPLNR